MKTLLELCVDYVCILYDIAHSTKVEAAAGLSMIRRDLHNDILFKLHLERTEEVQFLTDNLNRYTIRGKDFNVSNDYSNSELREIGRKLLVDLEFHSSERKKNELLECITDKLENFTKGKTYVIKNHQEFAYTDELLVDDDYGEENVIFKDIQIEDDSLNEFRYI